MNRYKIYSKMWLMALLLVAFVAGCASNPGEIPPAVVGAPTVTNTVPANLDTGVQINRRITATFSEATMDQATISTSSFKVTGPSATVVTGTVVYAGSSAVFTPTNPLAANTLYTATVTKSVKNQAGLALAADFIWTFTTGLSNDTTAPTIISTTAADGDTGVAINMNLTATFSEPMNPVTLASPATNFTLTLFGSTVPIPGVVTYLGNTATFNPTSDLLPNTKYTSTITTAATDLGGNALIAGAVANPWSWTTNATADLTAPKITVTDPVDDATSATRVAIDKKIIATFSKAMDPATMVTSNFTVQKTGPPLGTPLTGTVAYDVQHNTATFSPLGVLENNTEYTVTITNGVKDLAGNALIPGLVPDPWKFKTVLVTAIDYGPAGKVDLGTAGTYGIMANSAMTLSAPAKSHIYGDVGILTTNTFTSFTLDRAAPSAASPISPYVTGQITSLTYNTVNRAAMVIAFNDLQAAWSNNSYVNKPAPAVTLTPPLPTSPIPAGGKFSAAGQDLTGMLLGPGIYAANTAAGTLALSNSSGPLVLDAGGNPDAVFIFQASDMTTTSGSVVLRNGAQSKNVYWVLTKTATIGDSITATTFQGTILAGTAVTVGLDTSVEGRALAGAGLVSGVLTIDGGVITVP